MVDNGMVFNQSLRSKLPPQAFQYCETRGIILVGELFRLCPLTPSFEVTKGAEFRETIKRFIEKVLGLPLNFCLDEAGWLPAYATDPKILELWKGPATAVLKAPWEYSQHESRHGILATDRWLEENKIQYCADLFRAKNSLLYTIQKAIRRVLPLHAGMYVPKNWRELVIS